MNTNTTRTPFGTEVPMRAGGATTGAYAWRPKSLEEWIKYAPTDYLLCWVEGHRHDEWLGESLQEIPDGVLLYQVCDRCGLPMDKFIAHDGGVDSSNNTYYYYRMHKYPYPYIYKDNLSMRSTDLKGKRKLIRLELRRRGAKGYKKPELPKAARDAGLHNTKSGVSTGAVTPVRFQPATG